MNLLHAMAAQRKAKNKNEVPLLNLLSSCTDVNGNKKYIRCRFILHTDLDTISIKIDLWGKDKVPQSLSNLQVKHVDGLTLSVEVSEKENKFLSDKFFSLNDNKKLNYIVKIFKDYSDGFDIVNRLERYLTSGTIRSIEKFKIEALNKPSSNINESINLESIKILKESILNVSEARDNRQKIASMYISQLEKEGIDVSKLDSRKLGKLLDLVPNSVLNLIYSGILKDISHALLKIDSLPVRINEFKKEIKLTDSEHAVERITKMNLFKFESIKKDNDALTYYNKNCKDLIDYIISNLRL